MNYLHLIVRMHGIFRVTTKSRFLRKLLSNLNVCKFKFTCSPYVGVLKNWQALAGKPLVSGAINGVNASVVGLLLAALYQPVFSSAVVAPIDMALVIAGFYLHKKVNLSVLRMIVFFVAAGLVTGMM